MPSLRNTAPTIRRIRIVEAGAVVRTIFLKRVIEQTLCLTHRSLWTNLPKSLRHGRRGWRRELSNISEAEVAVNRADLFHGLIEPIISKLLVLKVLEVNHHT